MQMGGGALLRAQVGGCDMPATAGRDRLTPGEIAYVMDRRKVYRASWQACAEMVRRPTHDVRMACDPDYAAAHAPPKLADAEPARKRPAALPDDTGPLAMVLKALFKLGSKSPARTGGADTPRITASAVAASMGVGGDYAGVKLRQLRALKLVVSDEPAGSQIRLWAVSARGEREVERMAGVQ